MLYDKEKFNALGKTFGLEGAELLAFVEKQQELAEKRREEEQEEKHRRRKQDKKERSRIAEEEIVE